MLEFSEAVSEYFDPAYMKTADGMRELQAMYDDCPVVVYPDANSPGCEVLRLNPMIAEPPVCQRLDAYIRGLYSIQLHNALKEALWAGKVKLPSSMGGSRAVMVSDVSIDRIYSNRGLDTDEWVNRLRESEDDPVTQLDIQMSARVRTSDVDFGNSFTRKMFFHVRSYFNLMTRSFVSTGKISNGRFCREKRGIALDDYLVPFIGNANMEEQSEQILTKIFPDALKAPKRLDIKKALAILGMEVHFVRITRDFKFMGRVFFEEGDIEVYDSYGKARPFHVKKGTILVDDRVLRRTEAVDWTVVHEIYHFLQHREFFYLQKIYDGTLKCLSCTTQEYKQLGKDSPLYWIEWQTDRMVARLMMPMRTAKPMAERFLGLNAHFGKTGAMERTIIALSELYGVSKQTAKYRMQEMGFSDTRGVFNYVDNGYIPAYYGIEDMRKNLTPDIPEDAALELYISNPEFRNLIDTGRFCFVENHFCVRDEKYIFLGKSAGPSLTKYAREHIDECCILFDKTQGEKRYTYSAGTFNSEIIYSGPELYRPVDVPATKPMDRVEVMNRRLAIYLDAVENTPLRFGPALKYHREHRDFTQEQLAEQVNITSKQLFNYEASQVKKPVQRTVIAMCIALKLETDLSDALLTKGRCMPGTEPEDLVLLYVLHTMYEYSIPYCNHFLKNRCMKPLTKEGNESGEIAS